MLPLLFFELAWKSIWLLKVALPLWSTDQMDARTWEIAMECVIAVIFLVVIPRGYVFEHYVKGDADARGEARDGSAISASTRSSMTS
jgi:hypothetical protein